MKIRKFEEKYNDLVNQFIISIYIDEFGFEQYREELENEFNMKYQKNGGDFWICFDADNKIIGTIALERLTENEVLLKKMYVDSNYRGKGIAQELLEMAFTFCRENEIKKIMIGTFEKLERAIKFYEKNGFKELEKERRNDGAKFYALEF